MAEVINGQLGVNKSQLINLLGSKMYRGDVVSVAVKELLQNSFDAVKIAQRIDGIQDPMIDITLDDRLRTVTVSDNGCGMTPEIVQKAFFTIGGSYKGDVPAHLRSGGLGLAKMAFLFSSERISIETIRNGVVTTVDTTPEEIQEDRFLIHTNTTSRPNGTTVKVWIPESYTDDNGVRKPIWFHTPDIVRKPLIYHTLHFTCNGKDMIVRPIPDGYAKLGIAKANFGEIEIFVRPYKTTWNEISAQIYISGLYQFRKNFCINTKGRMEVILNILPSVTTSSNVYPINNTREGFNVSVDPEVKDIEFLLKKLNSLMDKKSAKAMFESKISSSAVEARKMHVREDPDSIFNDSIKAVQSAFFSPTESTVMKNTVDLTFVRQIREDEKKCRESTLDVSGIDLSYLEVTPVDFSSLDINRAVVHNNTSMIISEECATFLDALGEKIIQLRDLLKDVYPELRLNRQFFGLSFDTRYAGVRVNPSIFNFIGINPFAWIDFDLINYVQARTEMIVHELAHEITHNLESGHYDGFCAGLLVTYEKFWGLGETFVQWRKELYDLVKENVLLITQYQNLFKSSHNTDDGFDID